MVKFYVQVSFYDAQVLYHAHPEIKTLKFVIGECFENVADAHKAAVAYVNAHFSDLHEPVEFVSKVPVCPKTKEQWDAIPAGYFCAESPTEWTLSVWKKFIDVGWLWNAYKIQEIFTLDILQAFDVKANNDDTPVLKWEYNPLKVDECNAQVPDSPLSKPKKNVRWHQSVITDFSNVTRENYNKVQDELRRKLALTPEEQDDRSYALHKLAEAALKLRLD